MVDLITHLFAWGWCLIPIAAVAIVWWMVSRNNGAEYKKTKRNHRDWWRQRAGVWQSQRIRHLKRGEYSQAAECLDRANSCLDAAERK